MIDIDDSYDAAALAFMANASQHNTPFFFYFASHHTHAPQFAPPELAGRSRR
jgi:arylsulfatase A